MRDFATGFLSDYKSVKFVGVRFYFLIDDEIVVTPGIFAKGLIQMNFSKTTSGVMMKHRVTITEDEIEILLEALDSADWYGTPEFYEKLDALRAKLRRVLDIDYYMKKRKAGLISAERRRDMIRALRIRKIE